VWLQAASARLHTAEGYLPAKALSAEDLATMVFCVAND
jgi:hypothetical protein